MGPLGTTKMPIFWRENVNLLNPPVEHGGEPAYIFPNDNCLRFYNSKSIGLKLEHVEIRLAGLAASENKAVTLIHRAAPPQLDPECPVTDWDFEISTTGDTAATSIIFDKTDFGDLYLYKTDHLIIQMSEITAEANIALTFSRW